jgi:hypothetical protein
MELINRDGILYVTMASDYAKGGLSALLAYADFGWPFFSIVIAYVHKITSLPIELSAVVTNTLLFVVLTDALVLLSNKFLPNTRQVAFAALIFLCFLTLNHYRIFIGRDVGYWALCMLALYQFILYLEAPSIKKALIWQILMIFAVLFRIDGVVILLGLPFFLLMIRPPAVAFKQIFHFFYLPIAGTFIALFIAIDQSSLASVFSKIGSVTKYIDLENVLSKFNHNTELIETNILNKYSERYSALILGSGLVAMLVYKLTKALTLGYIGIYLYGLWKKILPNSPSPYRSLIGYFLALNIIILLGFIFTEYFISKRYTVLAVISLLFLMLPRLCVTLETIWLSKNKLVIVILGTLFFVTLIDSVTHTNSKAYIKDTAIWSSKNLPENSTALTTSKIIKYYFNLNQPVAEISLIAETNIGSYKNYDYLIVVIEKGKYKDLKKKVASMLLEPIFESENKRGSKATVYAIKPIE